MSLWQFYIHHLAVKQYLKVCTTKFLGKVSKLKNQKKKILKVVIFKDCEAHHLKHHKETKA